MPTTQTQLGIRTGDTVRVLTGNDRGKKGRVLSVSRATGRVILEGINLVTKHSRPSRRAPHGGRIEQPAPLHVSNVRLICPNCSKPTSVKRRQTANGFESICRHCSEVIVRKERA